MTKKIHTDLEIDGKIVVQGADPAPDSADTVIAAQIYS